MCCPQLLMAQVLTRMNMSWLAERHSSDSPKTFSRVLCLVIAYFVVESLLTPPAPHVEIVGNDSTMHHHGMMTTPPDGEMVGDDMNPEVIITPADVPFMQGMLYQSIRLAFGLYSLIVLIKL